MDRDIEQAGDHGETYREHRDTAAAAGQVPAEAVEAAYDACIEHGYFTSKSLEIILAAAAPLIAAAQQPKLLPGENMIVTLARRMIERGENPEINVTTALLMIIERLTGMDSDD